MKGFGHGVEFFHTELATEAAPVAFLDGFEWRGGGTATVWVLQTCPDSVTPEHWLKILHEAREAVLVFLSDESNLTISFRHGPIWMRVNG